MVPWELLQFLYERAHFDYTYAVEHIPQFLSGAGERTVSVRWAAHTPSPWSRYRTGATGSSWPPCCSCIPGPSAGWRYPPGTGRSWTQLADVEYQGSSLPVLSKLVILSFSTLALVGYNFYFIFNVQCIMFK